MKISYHNRRNAEEEILIIDPNSPSVSVHKLRRHISRALCLPVSSFQLFSSINNTEVMLTDSWSLSDFELGPLSIRVHNDSPIPSEEHRLIFRESIEHCINDNSAALQSLLTSCHEADLRIILNIEDEDGWTLLHTACSCNQEEFIKTFIHSFTDIDIETHDGWTPLLIAADFGLENIVKALLPHAQINKLSKRKGSALHRACLQSQRNTVRLLLENGADPNLKDRQGKTPVEYTEDPYTAQMILGYLSNKTSFPLRHTNFEGQLLMKRAFLKDKTVFVKNNDADGVIEIYSSKGKKLSKIKHKDIINIAPGRNKKGDNYKMKLYYKNKKKVFYTISKTYRDDWIQSIQTSAAKNYNKNTNEKISKRDLRILDTIENNHYSIVYKAENVKTGKIYVIKALLKKYMAKQNIRKFIQTECKIMKSLNNPFVISARCIYEDKESINIVMDYCAGGDLENLILDEEIDENTARFYLAEIILGLEYIHSLGIVHRDIKPRNIFIDEHGHIKIGDFGVSKFQKKPSKCNGVVGTRGYIPPEMIKHSVCGRKGDFYSLGVLMFEMLSGMLPTDSDKNYFHLVENEEIEQPKVFSQEAKDLIEKLLEKKQDIRPGINEIKQHPFFNGIDWVTIGYRT